MENNQTKIDYLNHYLKFMEASINSYVEYVQMPMEEAKAEIMVKKTFWDFYYAQRILPTEIAEAKIDSDPMTDLFFGDEQIAVELYGQTYVGWDNYYDNWIQEADASDIEKWKALHEKRKELYLRKYNNDHFAYIHPKKHSSYISMLTDAKMYMDYRESIKQSMKGSKYAAGLLTPQLDKINELFEKLKNCNCNHSNSTSTAWREILLQEIMGINNVMRKKDASNETDAKQFIFFLYHLCSCQGIDIHKTESFARYIASQIAYDPKTINTYIKKASSDNIDTLWGNDDTKVKKIIELILMMDKVNTPGASKLIDSMTKGLPKGVPSASLPDDIFCRYKELTKKL